MKRDAKVVLVAEDDVQVQGFLVRLLTQWGYDVTAVRTCSAASAVLISANVPDLVLLDVHLQDGCAVQLVAEMAELRPAPEVIAMSGVATCAEVFAIAQHGARSYLPKPFGAPELREAIDRALSTPARLEPHVRHTVPAVPMRDTLTDVRNTAVDQAMALAGGNYSTAGRFLGVSRQAVQKIMRGRPDGRAER